MTEKGGFTPNNAPDEPPPPYPGPTGYPSQQYPQQPGQFPGGQQDGVLPGQTGGQPYTQYAQQQTNTLVVTQAGALEVVQEDVPDNMGLAIFATLFCCFPIGIVAILKASEARSAVNRGDLVSAIVSSQESKKLSHHAIGCGIIILVVLLCLVLALTLS